MDKYTEMKSFHKDSQLQFYMYAFMYVDPETMSVYDHFTSTKILVVNYKKMSTPGTVPENWLRFCYIPSKYYELDQNFDDTEF